MNELQPINQFFPALYVMQFLVKQNVSNLCTNFLTSPARSHGKNCRNNVIHAVLFSSLLETRRQH